MTFEICLPFDFNILREVEDILEAAAADGRIGTYKATYSGICMDKDYLKIEITTKADDDAVLIKMLTGHLTA